MPTTESAAASKKQKIEHLSQREWLLRRPETFLGAVEPADLRLPAFGDGDATAARWTTVRASPALRHIANELVTNSLDNAHRDDTQRYIKLEYADGVLRVSNDGSVVRTEDLTLAFGVPQSGSNFDDDGEERYTAGRNGVGGKAANIFATRFAVLVHNAAEKRRAEQTWRDNMAATDGLRTAASARKTNLTQVEWAPDFARLGGRDDAAMAAIVHALAHQCALCAPAHVKVSLDGAPLKLAKPEHYCRALGGESPVAADVVRVGAREALRVCVAFRGGGEAEPPWGASSLALGFVNSTPCAEGSLARHVLAKVAEIVEAKAKAKRDAAAKDVHVTPAFVKARAVVVAVALVPNPRFTSQTKECLDTPAKDWGFKWEPSAAFVSALERSPLVEAALASARSKATADAAKATKTTRKPSIDKYEPALRLHKGRATLLLTEGDSAKNFAVAGLSVTGRTDYGVYPLRGKFLNVRGLPAKAVAENKEAKALLQILGLQLGGGGEGDDDHQRYAKLPYARLMVMADMDQDGSHICALVANFLDVVAPGLLRAQPDFLCRFATALIRVTLPRGGALGFHTQIEYDRWRAARLAAGEAVGAAKYYKGLGTSTPAMAKEYFRALDRNTVRLRHTGAPCAEALDLCFHKGRADDRKAFLSAVDARAIEVVDYGRGAPVPLAQFVRAEVLPQYALGSVRRAIPSAVDGLKVAQRKILFGARALGLRGAASTKVSIATGKIAARTNYHHGDASLSETIVGMCRDYAGAPNLHLLVPDGSFGCRHNHEAAAPRYIETRLHDPLQALLYPPADDAVLERVVDEGLEVEPTRYVPVLPAVLAFGARGIATGWSTDCPQYKPLDLLEASLAALDGRPPPALAPWYRGFGGTVAPDGDDGAARHAFVVHGRCEWRGADLHVLEVPPFKETDAYVADWRKLCETVEPGPTATDEVVHWVLKKCPPSVTPAQLGLEKRVGFGNVHLLDARGALRKYASPHEVVAEHAAARLALYEARLAADAARAEAALRAADAKARFLALVVAGALDLRALADEAAACAALRARHGFGDDDDDEALASLLRLPLASLTKKGAADARAKVAQLEAELAALRARTPAGVWRAELEALRAALL
jgi:DNA topoisomerase-2